MNERIRELVAQATKRYPATESSGEFSTFDKEKFAQLIVAKVLDEVATRAFVSGDRAWSDDVDRQWVELEFGIGKLAELKNEHIISQ